MATKSDSKTKVVHEFDITDVIELMYSSQDMGKVQQLYNMHKGDFSGFDYKFLSRLADKCRPAWNDWYKQTATNEDDIKLIESFPYSFDVKSSKAINKMLHWIRANRHDWFYTHIWWVYSRQFLLGDPYDTVGKHTKLNLRGRLLVLWLLQDFGYLNQKEYRDGKIDILSSGKSNKPGASITVLHNLLDLNPTSIPSILGDYNSYLTGKGNSQLGPNHAQQFLPIYRDVLDVFDKTSFKDIYDKLYTTIKELEEIANSDKKV